MPVAIVTGGNKGIGLGVVSKILLFIIFVHFFIFVYLIFVGVVSISRTLISKSIYVGFKFQNPFLLLPGKRTVQTVQGGRLPYCQRWGSWQGREKYYIFKSNLCFFFKFWTLLSTGSSGEPWSRGALSQIPPLWPWRPCHCWGLEGHHQGEVRSAFFEPVWRPTKHET